MVNLEGDRGWIGRVFLRWPRWCFRNDYHDIVFRAETGDYRGCVYSAPFRGSEVSDSTPRTHALAFG